MRALVLAGGLFVFASAAAQTLEEVIVTAEFSPTRIEELAASVVVLDQQTVTEAGVQHFEELIPLVPNLTLSGEGNRARYFQVRGIGELAQYEGAPNPSVGFIVDDVDFSAIGGVATLFDVSQVEVLRGPQGTRYGANSLAGLVYVTTAAPPDQLEVSSELTLGDDGARALGLSVGGPLSETAAARLSMQQYESDGFRDNPFLGRGDTNKRDEATLRAKLVWQPRDALQASLSAFYVDIDDGYDAFAIDNSLTTYSDDPGQDAQRSLGGSLRLEYQSDRFTLTSVTGAARSDISFGFDADWGNESFWAPYVYDFVSTTSRDRETLSQELRIASSKDSTGWLFGVYGLKLREANRTTDVGIYIDPAFPDFPFLLDAAARRAYQATSSAVFGEVDFTLAEDWRLSIGARWENRDADYQDSGGNRFSPDEDMFGGQLTLSRRLGEALNAYGRVARGYKAGGFNLGLPVDDGRQLFDAEYLWNYELGLRGRSVNGRLSGDVVLFWSERDDQQVETTTQLDPSNPASFVFLTSNAGRGHNRGLEASISYQLNERWRFHGAVGLLDTEIESFGANQALQGRDQAHAPSMTFQLGASFEHPRGWFGRMDLVGQDEAYIDYFEPGFGPDPRFCLDQQLPDYRLVNVRAGLRRDRWSAEIWARNLFDDDYAVRGFCFGNEPPNFPETLYLKRGDPRQVGVTLRLRY